MTDSDCLSTTSAQPNSTLLAAIQACQAAAFTPYCYPLNGTRICVPSSNISFFWPRVFYPSDAEVALSTSPTSIPLLSNSGERTQSFPLSLYDEDAYRIPGRENERMLKIYFRTNYTQPPDPNSDTLELMSYNGPTLILVKTASPSSSSTTRSTTATRIASASASARSDGTTSGEATELGKSRPAVAGAVLGALAGFFVLGLLIFFAEKRTKRRAAEAALQPMTQFDGGRSSVCSRSGVTETPRPALQSLPREQGGQEEPLPPYQTVVREQPPAYIP